MPKNKKIHSQEPQIHEQVITEDENERLQTQEAFRDTEVIRNSASAQPQLPKKLHRNTDEEFERQTQMFEENHKNLLATRSGVSSRFDSSRASINKNDHT